MTPDVLYHYTSPGGLTAILESSELRATDARFLNDALELKYAWSEFKATLKARAAEESPYSEAYRAQLEAMRSANAEDLDLMENRVFSVSLTQLPDDIPQWRSYASDGRGVAIGYDAKSMQLLPVPYYKHTETGDFERTESGDLVPLRAVNTGQIMTWGAILGPVGYGAEARETAIGHELKQIEAHCGTNDVVNFEAKVYSGVHLIPIHLSALALVKDEGFKSEQEFRLTIPEHFPTGSAGQLAALKSVEPTVAWDSMPVNTVDVQFREGGPALFKPYTAIPFPKSAPVKVVLGPNVNAELAKPVTRRLLDRHGFGHTEIVRSEMSYRT
jgi:hypothetical protein